MTVGVGQAWFPAWKNYKKSLEKRGVKTITLDLYHPGWAKRLMAVDKKINFYLWHSDTWEENYRRIHDRVYFIEKILKKPIFPDLNQYYSFNDKIKQKEIFDYLKIPQIPTFIAQERGLALMILKKISWPIIIKDAYSAAGTGVFKIDNEDETKKIIEKIFHGGYCGIKNHFYAQKFIPNLKKDLRIITIGDQIGAAYWRQSKNDWRHNICCGAEAIFKNIPQKAEKFCLEISKKMGFHWLAYDLMVKNDKIKIIEWTCNFGCQGPEKQGIDLRDKMVEYALKNYQNFQKNVPNSSFKKIKK